MGSLQFAKTVFTMFYTTTMIAFTSLQLMGLKQVTSLSNTDAHYFFYQNSEYPKDCSDVQRQCSSQNSSGVYLIKPDGFREPFEVFCDNDVDSGGWTVIQRREDGIVAFDRNWTHYRNGFGFLSTEYFIGNDKLAYLTNQAAYELLIEVELENRCSFYTSYKGFRIADEFGQYKLQHVVLLDSNGSLCLSDCPADEFFINECTEKCFCSNNRLENCSPVSCDNNAICDISSGVEMCSCNNGYEGDGLTCTLTTTTTARIPTTTEVEFRDCQEVFDGGQTNSGTYTIKPNGWTSEPFTVYCEMENERGWTLFQRRSDGTPSFNQNWASYKAGFGDVTESFWLGNDKLHYLTTQKNYILRIDVTTDGTSRYGEYTDFEVGSESTNYVMNELGTHSGSIGYYLYYSRGKQFSTPDQDNDQCGNFDCAEGHKSGWWHYDNYCSYCYGSFCDYFPFDKNGNTCHSYCTIDNLNGVYNGGNGERIFTYDYYYYYYCSVQNVEMKIRPS